MRAILNFELRVANWVLAGVVAGLCLTGCGGMPSFPDPQPGRGQIVIELQGEPREGVTGPVKETEIEEYQIKRVSVEQGKAYERVDYDEIEDVIVILNADVPTLRDVPAPDSRPRVLTISDDGFDRSQIATSSVASGRKSWSIITVVNERDQDLTLYGFSNDGASFEVLAPANGKATAKTLHSGTYEIYCDEDETLSCTWYATKGNVWIGPSDEYPFFDYLPSGEYEICVYAPRLPEWSKIVKVTAGQRTSITAKLTVNDLPE